jgi:hypothetical protein
MQPIQVHPERCRRILAGIPIMKNLLRVLAALLAATWYVCEVSGYNRVDHPYVRTTINPARQTLLQWSSLPKTRYKVYLVFGEQSLPVGVRTTFFDWRNPPGAKWSAALEVSYGNTGKLTQRPLRLRPAFQSGTNFFFQIGEVPAADAESVALQVLPQAPPPFECTNLALQVEAAHNPPEALFSRKLTSRAGAILAGIATALLGADYLRMALQSSARNKAVRPE